VISPRARALLAFSTLAGLFSGAAATVPALAAALIAAVYFDHFDPGGLTVMQLVFTAIASVSVRLGLSILSRVSAGAASMLVGRDLRAAAATTLGNLPLGTLAEARPGAFEAVLLGDVDTVATFCSERLPQLTAAYGVLLTAWLVLLVRDRTVSLIALAATVGGLALAALAGLRRKDREGERTAREALGAAIFAAARATELDRSLPDAGASTRAVPGLARAYRVATERRDSAVAVQAAVRRVLAGTFGALLVLTALALGGPHAAPSLLMLFAALGLRSTSAWVVAFGTGAASAGARAAWARIAGLLAQPPVVGGAAGFPERADVRFRDVTFAYPGTTAGRGDVLRGVDVTAPAGAVTAIVGPSGSGKTTLTRLAARFWDVDRGAVEIGGVDVREVALDALMRGITCVFQDVSLLDDTVAVNLRLGRPEASEAELIAAAKAAGAHDFISAMPYGYDTVIGDRGLRLSRGERQRLQIARAFLKEAPIVILDEPTASMDPATEAEITAALAPLLSGKTVLLVAHRLSTVVDADRIVVLDHSGRVEAQGGHAELLGTSPTYAAMWRAYRGSDVAPTVPATSAASAASAASATSAAVTASSTSVTPAAEGVAT